MLTSIVLCLHIIIILTITAKVIFRRLPVGTSLAWIIIVAVVPFIGFGFYMLIGDHRLGRRRLRLGDLVRRYYQRSLNIEEGAEDESHPDIQDAFMKIGDVAARGTGFHIRSNNTVELLTKPEAMFDAIIRDIDAAQHTCFLEFYIIDPQGRVDNVMDAVIRAAKRGVDCKILADHIGSRKFFKSSWPKTLRSAGVEVVDSLPTGIIKTFFLRSDLRNHRKIIVIDRRVSYTGSFNLADPQMFNQSKKVGSWIDVFIRMEGDVSEALSVVFNTDYVLDTHDRKSAWKIPALPDIEVPEHARPERDDAPIQIIPSGPEMATSVIYETIIASLYMAQKEIIITTPYLIPDEPLLLALTNASRRGVDVKIIVPEKVDSVMVRFASHSYFGELLVAGIEIYEYQAGLLHSKFVMVDESVCYVGTLNLDMRSFYLNLEITLALHSEKDCATISTVLHDYIANSRKVIKDDWLDGRRSKPVVFAENLVRLASPLL